MSVACAVLVINPVAFAVRYNRALKEMAILIASVKFVK